MTAGAGGAGLVGPWAGPVVASGAAPQLNGGNPAPAFVAPARTAQTVRVEARQMGFEGDPCDECGQLMMVRNGTCLKCMNCGGTSGCS